MTKDPCETCGASDYYYWRARFNNDGSRTQYCSSCFSGPMPSLSPDVFFDKSKGSNQIDPNLCDRYSGPIPFSSKREKAAIMKRLGLQEDGDRKHGARNFDKHSHERNWK